MAGRILARIRTKIRSTGTNTSIDDCIHEGLDSCPSLPSICLGGETNGLDIDTYVHDGLDLSTDGDQIRLLQFIPHGTIADRPLRFKIVTVDFPPEVAYCAISYVWGRPGDERLIYVNDKAFLVRPNCYLALKQAYQQWTQGRVTSSFVWIDSVCIDQDNGLEKNHQVSIMGNIYGEAAQVFSCIGEHRDDIQYLFAQMQIISPRLHECKNVGIHEIHCAECAACFEDLTPALTSNGFQLFVDASEALDGREYWTRIWVAQETYHAKELWILCGDDALPAIWLNMLHRFWGWIHYRGRKVKLFQDVWRQRLYSLFFDGSMQHILRRRRTPLANVLRDFPCCKCSLPMDRIYALLSLITWPEGQDPIQPNYDKTAVDLAVELVDRGYADIRLMLTELKIFCDDSVLRQRIAANRARREKLGPSFHKSPQKPSERISLPVSLGPTLHWRCGTIGTDPSGNITAAFERSPYDFPLSVWPTDGRLSEIVEQCGDRTPRRIVVDKKTIGLICYKAVEGDMLLPLRGDDLDEEQCFLVLRKTHGEMFDLVGHAVLSGWYQLRPIDREPNGEWPGNVLTVKVELKMTAADVVLLYAQDHASKRRYNSVARWQRLVIEPTSDPENAVRLIEVELSGSAADMT